MGWASGSTLAESIIKAVKDNVPDEQARVNIYRVLLNSMRNQDWDTEDEAMGIDPLFDGLIEE